MNQELAGYYENTRKPWGTLFYQIVWEQIPKITNGKILDFGSGFGFTADHFAKNHEVTAIEPNSEMVLERSSENDYRQIVGDLNELKRLPENSFDLIICHNVLEYIEERCEIIKEFYRILKPNGIISIVKHNHAGRIMQKVVFENNVEEAISLLDGAELKAPNFGKIHYYEIEDIKKWVGNDEIRIEKRFGIRTFWALQQNNEIKYEKDWQDKMFEIEMKVSEMEEYRNISFFHHVLLRKC